MSMENSKWLQGYIMYGKSNGFLQVSFSGWTCITDSPRL